MGVKHTCKGCKKQIKKFCRKKNIGRNSPVCRIAQKGNISKARKKLRGDG